MLKLNLTLLLCGFVSITFSQNLGGGFTSSYAYGESFENRAYQEKFSSDVAGSPLLFDNWLPGEVVLNNGEKYLVEKINFDALAQKFLYMYHDTMFEFGDNVQKITVHDNSADNPVMVFRDDIDPESVNFVQMLDSGKVTIFAHIDKKPEGENYSNGIVNNIRKYTVHKTTYALVKKEATPVKFDASSLEELTADKAGEMKSYIKENRLKVKKETDFLKAITYYNSL
ncbi:MAG TPA: hypothetical protein VG847_11005 [Chitinophagaceae bacterium]|nr:hypothetical protein [Chitinophagaceae bacterium]